MDKTTRLASQTFRSRIDNRPSDFYRYDFFRWAGIWFCSESAHNRIASLTSSPIEVGRRLPGAINIAPIQNRIEVAGTSRISTRAKVSDLSSVQAGGFRYCHRVFGVSTSDMQSDHAEEGARGETTMPVTSAAVTGVCSECYSSNPSLETDTEDGLPEKAFCEQQSGGRVQNLRRLL